MDLLAQIIQRKKTTHDDVLSTVEQLLKDIIAYDKLATNKKFQQLDNPIVAKRCPALAKTLDTTTYEYTILKHLLPLLIDFTGRSMSTLALSEQTTRDKILNQTYGFDLTIYDFALLHEKPAEYIALKETIDSDAYKLLLLVPDGTKLKAYIMTNDDRKLKTLTSEPLMVTSGANTLTLISYSKLGNNDYPFGHINGTSIRIRDGHLIVGSNHYDLDINKLSMMTSEKEIADYLLKVYEDGETNGIDK